MTLSTTPRPTYDGPRSKFTLADGTYRVTLVTPTYKFRREDRAAAAVVIEEIARALGREVVGSGISTSVGHAGPIPGGYSILVSTFDVSAAHDADALAQVLPAVVSASACGVQIVYMWPNEFGGSGHAKEAVVKIDAPATIENLPASLRYAL